MHTVKCLFALCLLVLPSILVLQDGTAAAASPDAESLYSLSATTLASGDTAGARGLLDQVLKTNSKHGPALIARGNLYLAQRKVRSARNDFSRALDSESARIRALGYIGLGGIESRNPKLIKREIEHYRLATEVDSTCCAAYYALARSGLIYGQTVGFRVAGEALADLLCFQPDYLDAYNLWREKILDKTEEEIKAVDHSMSAYLVLHPDSAAWWVDLAWDSYDLDESGKALETLSALKKANPEFESPNYHLLLARCRLELGDTLQFQEAYNKALVTAEKIGDYVQLIREAETIFSHSDMERWKNQTDNQSRAAFFRFFWAGVNPDKFSEFNPRLVEHYSRLRYAERNYRLRNPHSPIQTKRDVNLYLSFQSGFYDYKSEVFFERSHQLALDPRGLLYIRYGPPDLIRTAHDLPNSNKRGFERMSNPAEVWHYGGAEFYFERMALVADYIFRPPQVDGSMGDMMKAMDTQRFRAKNIHESEEYYSAQFLPADNEGVEVEFYQEETLPESCVPEAVEAIYDSTWFELSRDESPLYRVSTADPDRYLAVHTMNVPAGIYNYALRIKAGQKSWNGRGQLDLKAFNSEAMSLSAIVLGTEPEPGLPAHERKGIRLLPRPSLIFSRGEQIKVYLEYYNLHNGREGLRSYKEFVDVVRYAGEGISLGRITGKLLGLLTFGEAKESTSITHTFDREAEAGSGPVAETFTLDSSVLAPGRYRLLIEARDNADGYWDNEGVLFEIEGE